MTSCSWCGSSSRQWKDAGMPLESNRTVTGAGRAAKPAGRLLQSRARSAWAAFLSAGTHFARAAAVEVDARVDVTLMAPTTAP